MGMTAAALPIIWVAVGGRSDLTATLIGTLVVLSAFQALTIYGSQYALVFDGRAAGADRAAGPERAGDRRSWPDCRGSRARRSNGDA